MSADALQLKCFWDQYNTTIHYSTVISNFEKLNYFKNLLTGFALESISPLSLTDSNYERAIDLLKEHFNNPQISISSYIKVLATLPKVHSMKHVAELRDLCNKIENSVTSLKDCDVPTDTYGNLLIGVIFERIPQELKVIVSRSFKNNFWNLENLLDVFKQESMVRETCFAVSSSGNQDKEEDRFFTPTTFQTNSYKRKDEKILICAFCSENHSSNKCSNVSDISQRKQLLIKNERCFIYLRKNHIVKDCKSNYKCNKCQMRHNISICTKDTKTLYAKENKNNIMLQSAVVCVSNVNNHETSTFSRVLFNNCSQRTYITTSLKKN